MSAEDCWRGADCAWAGGAVAGRLGPAILQRQGDAGSAEQSLEGQGICLITRPNLPMGTVPPEGKTEGFCTAFAGRGSAGGPWYSVRCSWLLEKPGTCSGSKSKSGWLWAICCFCFRVIFRVCDPLPYFGILTCPQPIGSPQFNLP